eukprot:TRINITY_DN8380_c0_g1_i1.p1 TRINITY_DN8380_c0_g1~~TRINITY_DN8380_c0_g1_i1.p1  ORF type:complete len:666 (-),score=147.70 TRINITY_DN8380_c0_g1_i1:157-2154(-)
MENYESLGTIGEGTYGVVIKARHKETGQIVAIKKFKESDEDEQVRKTALREVRILKQLKHDNIVNLVEVFRRKGKLYLVFEYVEKTILEELEKHPYGLSELEVKKCTWQLLKGVEYCHDNNIIHRDIKPENILMSKHGALKLCDFGFARALAGHGAKYTDYVATRWYRSPELLVGDTEYGKPVDVWAIGCNVAELSNGIPLFPGESDIDQLFQIIKCFGKLTARQVDIFKRNPLYVGIELPKPLDIDTIEKRFAPTQQKYLLGLLQQCLHYDPEHRNSCAQLLASDFFTGQGFDKWFEDELRQIMEKDANPLVVKRKKNRRPRSQQGTRHAEPTATPISELDSQSTQHVTAEDRSRSSSIFEGTDEEPPVWTAQQKVDGHAPQPGTAPSAVPSQQDSLSDLYLLAQKQEHAQGMPAMAMHAQQMAGHGAPHHAVPPMAQPPQPQQSQPAHPSQFPEGVPQSPLNSSKSPIPNPLKGGHFYMGPFSTVINTSAEPPHQGDMAKYNVLSEEQATEGSDHLPNLSRMGQQINIPVVAFPHIPNDQTTYLSQGTVKKEPGSTTFPTLNPLDPNASSLLKYNSSKKKGKKHTENKYDSKPLSKQHSQGPSGFGSSKWGAGPSSSSGAPSSSTPPTFVPHNSMAGLPTHGHDLDGHAPLPPPSREGRGHKF